MSNFSKGQGNREIIRRCTLGLRTSKSADLSASGGLTLKLRKRAIYGWELDRKSYVIDK